MNSYLRMNEVIEYIEKHIHDEIKTTELAKIACCPADQLPRIFSFLTNTSLTNYIRERWLSVAAKEIIMTEDSIIEIAFRAGYESNTAFTRAFKKQYAITPSKLRKEKNNFNLLVTEPFHFETPISLNNDLNYRITEGRIKMAAVTHLEFEAFGPCVFLGKGVRTKAMTSDISQLWGKCFADGTFETLSQLKEFLLTEEDQYIGFVSDLNHSTQEFTYLVGLFMKENTPIPEGFLARKVNNCLIAHTWVEGESDYDIFSNGPMLTRLALEEKGYTIDWENYFLSEVYTAKRYAEPLDRGDKTFQLDYYVPCLKKPRK